MSKAVLDDPTTNSPQEVSKPTTTFTEDSLAKKLQEFSDKATAAIIQSLQDGADGKRDNEEEPTAEQRFLNRVNQRRLQLQARELASESQEESQLSFNFTEDSLVKKLREHSDRVTAAVIQALQKGRREESNEPTTE